MSKTKFPLRLQEVILKTISVYFAQSNWKKEHARQFYLSMIKINTYLTAG